MVKGSKINRFKTIEQLKIENSEIITVTPYEFESQAKTGDLLLFRTIDKCSDCQRFFTCDNYDLGYWRSGR